MPPIVVAKIQFYEKLLTIILTLHPQQQLGKHVVMIAENLFMCILIMQ
nr:MAG TPA: hypothetical protein [Caudoviricetes sp.]